MPRKPRTKLFPALFFLLGSLFLCTVAPSQLFADKDFDPRKMAELQSLQQDLIQGEKPAANTEETEKAGAAQPAPAGKGTSSVLPPAQPGVSRVSDKVVQRSEDLYRQQFEILTEKKKPLERISVDLQSTLNYDSNVFQEKPARGDFYYTVGPGVKIDATDLYKALGFDVYYQIMWNQYFSFARLNHLNQYLNFDIPGGNKKLRIGKKLTVSGYIGLGLNGDSGASSSDQGLFKKAFEPFAGIRANYLLSKKFSTDFDYSIALRKTYGSVQTESGTETAGSSTAPDVTYVQNDFKHRLRYHYTPKTSFFGGFAYGFTTGSGSGTSGQGYDSNYIRITAGMDGKVTAKSTASLEAGWELRKYKERGLKNAPYLQAAYLVQLTRKLSARTVLLYDVQPSIQADTGIFSSGMAQFGITYQPINRLSWDLGTSLRISSIDNSWDNSDDSSATTETTSDTSNKYKDYDLTVDTSLKYYMNRWLAFRLAYQFMGRTSDQKGNDYIDHLATFGVTLG